ncbi:zymogen granule membrane protein 16 [Caretta caretta]|uniref:zymogen granule membrane protein 16 n=1 Tax=Caretta caretta TaxID=8467 RepID=UPI0020950953|nr:zymogen granule membrane protein 16 isoform X1 [Caretta caretta]XP_048710726.1 zymogen granule membrane protein 16 isoform X2 [Caretta caretta]XP_048710727.1 zymogen granule membrane protein 16 isoform X3 [Caretta caretta]XP_048710728.1 zymogen granule membrane protein 16 isoform X1 [Caretta caretta]XP_048710729.1 zymogen granule membrane protein 16 isoform X1 [Caretta caretta]
MLLLQILGVTLLLLAQSAGEQGRSLVPGHRRHSYSGEFGSASGTPFSYSGPDRWGPITALRIWEHCNSYISGIQLQFGARWGEMYGAKTQAQLEVTLLPDERITQVSGKQYTYIYQLIVSTNKGRIFFFGQPYGNSFNAIPLSCTEYLAFLTGHYSGGSLTGIAMHWAEPRKQE